MWVAWTSRVSFSSIWKLLFVMKKKILPRWEASQMWESDFGEIWFFRQMFCWQKINEGIFIIPLSRTVFQSYILRFLSVRQVCFLGSSQYLPPNPFGVWEPSCVNQCFFTGHSFFQINWRHQWSVEKKILHDRVFFCNGLMAFWCKAL